MHALCNTLGSNHQRPLSLDVLKALYNLIAPDETGYSTTEMFAAGGVHALVGTPPSCVTITLFDLSSTTCCCHVPGRRGLCCCRFSGLRAIMAGDMYFFSKHLLKTFKQLVRVRGMCMVAATLADSPTV